MCFYSTLVNITLCFMNEWMNELALMQKFFTAQCCYRPIRIKHSTSVCINVPLLLSVLVCSCIMLVNSSPLPIFFGALQQQLNISAQKDRVTGKYHGTPIPYFPDWEKNTLDFNHNIVTFTCKIENHTTKWLSFSTEQLTHTWEDHADVNPNDKIYYWVN